MAVRAARALLPRLETEPVGDAMIYGACHQPTQPETSAYSEALGMHVCFACIRRLRKAEWTETLQKLDDRMPPSGRRARQDARARVQVGVMRRYRRCYDSWSHIHGTCEVCGRTRRIPKRILSVCVGGPRQSIWDHLHFQHSEPFRACQECFIRLDAACEHIYALAMLEYFGGDGESYAYKLYRPGVAHERRPKASYQGYASLVWLSGLPCCS